MNVPYFQVPNDIFDRAPDLKDYEKLVYIYLCRCGNHGGQAFPSYDTIGRKCSISKRSAMRAVSNLIKLGFISKYVRPKGNKDNQTNLYEVFLPSDSQSPPPSDSLTPGSDSQSPNKELLYKELVSEKETDYVPKERLYTLTGERNPFLAFYLSTHRLYLNKDHVRVTIEQRKYIYKCLKILQEDFELDLHTWQQEVTEHFDKLPSSNNGNILAFFKASKRRFDIDPAVFD